MFPDLLDFGDHLLQKTNKGYQILKNKPDLNPAVVAEPSKVLVTLSNSSKENALGPRFESLLGIKILIVQN